MHKKSKPWVKSTYYHYIFNTCYNIDFHIQKTDRCEKCEEIKVEKSQNISISLEEKNLHGLNMAESPAMREEKKRDNLITNGNWNRNRPYCVIQMKSEDFKHFQNSSKMLQFSNLPYTKVFQLEFCKDDLHTVEYKLSH